MLDSNPNVQKDQVNLLEAKVQLLFYAKENGGDQDWANKLISLIDRDLLTLKTETMVSDNQGLWSSKILDEMLKKWADQNEYKSQKDNPTFAMLTRLFIAGNSAIRFCNSGLAEELIDRIAGKSIEILKNHSRETQGNQNITNELIDHMNDILIKNNTRTIVLDDWDYEKLHCFAHQNRCNSQGEAALELIKKELDPIMKNKGSITGTPPNAAAQYSSCDKVASRENSISLQ